MRILVLHESDWIEKGPHQHHHLMERLSKKGHEIRVIDHEILWKEDNYDGLISKKNYFYKVHKAISEGDVTVIRPSIIKLPFIEYLSYICTRYNEINEQLTNFRPHVIVGLGILNPNIGIKLARRYSVPFVYYSIDENFRLVPQKYFRWIARHLESKNIKNADSVLSINEDLREYTIEMGADPKKTEVIRAGVDFERFSSADGSAIREMYGLKEDDIVLFFMGWLYDFSGLKEVATELAKSDANNLKLLVLGKGDLWDYLQSIKKEYGLDGKLITVDWCPYDEVPGYLAASDICLLPAYKNDIMMNIVPIKMYEYMAAGKPVIATKLPGLMKEFGEGNGVVYVDRPEDALGMAIELVQQGTSGVEGKNASTFVKNLDWNTLTDEFERILIEQIVVV